MRAAFAPSREIEAQLVYPGGANPTTLSSAFESES